MKTEKEKDEFEIIESSCAPISQTLREICTVQTYKNKFKIDFLHVPIDKVLSGEIAVTIIE